VIQLSAFWKKTSKEGRIYYTGRLGNGRLLLFKNEKKESEKHPDLILYIVPENEKKEGRNQVEPEGDPDIPF